MHAMTYFIINNQYNAAYMRQWAESALSQLVAYSAPSHYLNQCWLIVNWTLRNKLQWIFNQNIKISVHENASENIVCEMAAILSRERWLKTLRSRRTNWHSSDAIFKSFSGTKIVVFLFKFLFNVICSQRKMSMIMKNIVFTKTNGKHLSGPLELQFRCHSQGSFRVCAEPMRDDVTL